MENQEQAQESQEQKPLTSVAEINDKSAVDQANTKEYNEHRKDRQRTITIANDILAAIALIKSNFNKSIGELEAKLNSLL